MAVARREQRARDIRVRVADKPPLQDFNRFFELTQLEVRLRLEVQVNVRVVGAEGKNAVKHVKRPLCLAPVVQRQPEHYVAKGEVRIERNRFFKLANRL